MNTPLVSIVVPTRERADTLIETLELLAELRDLDHEIVVCDNASEDVTPQVVASRNNPRILYVRAPQRLSMPANFALALGHARGQFVLTLGDDDLVIPGNLRRAVEHLLQHDADLVYWHRAFFYWGRYANPELAGYFGIPQGRGIHPVESRSLLHLAMFSRVSYEYLPNIYNALIRRSFLQRYRRSIGGGWFPDYAVSVDVITALLFGELAPNAWFLQSPASVSGISQHSNGMSVHHDQRESNRFAAELGFSNVSELMPASFRGAVRALKPRGISRIAILVDFEAVLRRVLQHRHDLYRDPERIERIWLRRLLQEGDVELRPDAALAIALASDEQSTHYLREDKDAYFFDLWNIPQPRLHTARFDGRDATVRHLLDHLQSIGFNESDES